MRQAVAQLIAGIYARAGSRAEWTRGLSELFGAEAFVLEAAGGAVLEHARTEGSPEVRLSTLRARVWEMIAGLSSGGVAPDAAWRKAVGRLAATEGASFGVVHVAVGVPASRSEGNLVLVLCRSTAFSVGEADRLGELAFHVGRASSMERPASEPANRLSPLPSLRVRGGEIDAVCPRMSRMLLEVAGARFSAVEMLRGFAQRALLGGIVRDVLTGRDGRRYAFLFVPLAAAGAGEGRVAAGEDVMVFAYDLDEAIEVPSSHLTALHPISSQQAEVARLLVNGMTIEEAAAELGVSPNTVRSHVSALFRNVGVSNRTDLARILVQEMIALRALAAAGLDVLQRGRRTWSTERRRASRTAAELHRRSQPRQRVRKASSPAARCS